MVLVTCLLSKGVVVVTLVVRKTQAMPRLIVGINGASLPKLGEHDGGHHALTPEFHGHRAIAHCYFEFATQTSRM